MGLIRHVSVIDTIYGSCRIVLGVQTLSPNKVAGKYNEVGL